MPIDDYRGTETLRGIGGTLAESALTLSSGLRAADYGPAWTFTGAVDGNRIEGVQNGLGADHAPLSLTKVSSAPASLVCG
jgi:hypothetical protein